MRLFHKDTNQEVRVGDTVHNRDGDKLKVEHIRQPHNEFGHGGRVTTEEGSYFANVYDLEWRT